MVERKQWKPSMPLSFTRLQKQTLGTFNKLLADSQKLRVGCPSEANHCILRNDGKTGVGHLHNAKFLGERLCFGPRIRCMKIVMWSIAG